MRRYLRLLALLSAVAFVAAACTKEETPTPVDGEEHAPGGMITSIGEGEGEVNILAWVGYIEDGSTSEAYDWVTQFEADTGCQVNVTVANTSDEMASLMQEGSGLDLVTASGDSSLRLISGDTVQPVNVDLIEGYDTIDERLQNAPWHTVDKDGDGEAEHYGVPYQWGSDVLMYNTDVFGDEPPDSWSVVFEEQNLPDGKSNAGRIEAYDGAIALASVALYVKATQPDLGIDDPYALTRDQFDAVLEAARQQRELVFRYWHDAYVQMDDFKKEGVVASTSWPFQANWLKFFEEEPIGSVIPKEGATGWADTTMMHVDAPHPNCAYEWMNWSITPKLQGDLASWFGSVPVVPSACEGNELLGDDGCQLNGIDDFDQIYFWKTPQADCFVPGGPPDCVPYYEWVTNYVAVIGGR